MTTKDELKKKLHLLIDSIEDEHTLHFLNEDIVPYIIENKASVQDPEEVLSEEQWKKLDEAIAQAEEGNVMNLEDFKKQMASWHTR
ncbi:MAG: hypothetical protein H7X88_00155 [Gloeobacteraceae cyanobacterium ES-bin-316]|nr:hypothetical protein [Ferruginibacter sp.]